MAYCKRYEFSRYYGDRCVQRLLLSSFSSVAQVTRVIPETLGEVGYSSLPENASTEVQGHLSSEDMRNMTVAFVV